MRAQGSAGGTHCEIRIGDSQLMIGGGAKQDRRQLATSLHYYVPEVDAMYARAIAAGAKSLMPPRDQEYGDRDCAIEDATGNQWYIGTAKGASYKPEGFRDVTLYLHPTGAEALMQFLDRAIGAQTLERYASPEGVVMHAKMKIGNSIVEIGEAHDQWPPIPTMIYLNVSDAGAAYARAIEAGAKSIMPPATQTYGVRMAAAEDPFGNQWYFAAPLPAR